MKEFIKTYRVPLILLACAVLVAAAVIAGRWQVEANNKSYDVVLDYSELELLAEQSEEDVSWWLEQFRDMGITRVGLTEESLASLMEDSDMAVTATVMDNVVQDADWRESYPAAFIQKVDYVGYDRFDVLVEVAGSDAVDFVVSAVQARLSGELTALYQTGEEAYLLLDGTVNDTLYLSSYSYMNTFSSGFTSRNDIVASKLMYISLGLMPEKVEIIQSLGLEIEPRTNSYNGHNDTKYAAAVLAGYEQYGITPSYLIAGGEAVIGMDDGVELAQSYVQSSGATIGLIETNVQRENITQSGVEDIATATGYDVVRVFSVWDYIQYRYAYYGYEGAEEIENTLFRAIVERNIRVVYFKPIKQTDNHFAYITDIQVYRDMFDSLNTRLAAHGITMGKATVMDNYQVPRLALLALGLGAGLGGVLLLPTFLPIKKKWTLVLAGVAAVCVALAWLLFPNAYRLAASFSSAVVFACLASAFFLKATKETKLAPDASLIAILGRSAAVLVPAVAIALAGGVMTAAPLSSTDFMLEIGIFRGVKAAQLIPLAFFCLLFLSYYGLFQNDRQKNTLDVRDFAGILRWTMPIWAILLAAVIGGAGYYYIARTGHESTVTVSTMELVMRSVLEEHLLARPRTKEFLLAFPCIMLAVYAAVRRLPFFTGLFGLVGVIGLTSVCNTFMHIRTPLYLGFVRTGLSLVFGIVVGIVYMVLFELCLRLYRLLEKKYGDMVRE
jgi:hypothetical protein